MKGMGGMGGGGGIDGNRKKKSNPEEDAPEFMDMGMDMGETEGPAKLSRNKKYYPRVSIPKMFPGMKMGEKRMMMMEVKMVGMNQHEGEAPRFDFEIHKAKMHK